MPGKKLIPKRPKLLPYGPGHAKNLAPWNHYNVRKLSDDLTRMFYYTFRGYNGPHPWGMKARPPSPEYQPLKVVDPDAGAPYRQVIEKHMRNPIVRQRWMRTLLELQQLLRSVDPRNPKVWPRPVNVR